MGFAFINEEKTGKVQEGYRPGVTRQSGDNCYKLGIGEGITL